MNITQGKAVDQAAKSSSRRASWPDLTLATVFFLSGAAALAYQITWQRMLFASFGIDIESVTIIVSTFMLGLGVGALAGGSLADRFPSSILFVFAAFEFGIGLFGLSSGWLIHSVADSLVTAPHFLVAGANFAMLLVPTSLMGATLPMLTTEAVRRRGGVGVSIGRLYTVNTLGAAAGAALLGTIGFNLLGLQEVTLVAATVNIAVALGATVVAARLR